jgi:threonine synthase
MPQDAPPVNVQECQALGADVHLVVGLISDAGRLAAQGADEHGWFDVSTLKEPYRVEGKKTMGYELAAEHDWGLPDVIIYPTGGGTGLIGMWKAFGELVELGWLRLGTILPRMVAVQSSGCAPVVRAFESNADRCEFWTGAETLAAGLRVPKPLGDRLILDALRASQGTAIAVTDEEIVAAGRAWAEVEGLWTCPEGAATLAAAQKLTAEGWLHTGERVVLFNTGSAFKYVGS